MALFTFVLDYRGGTHVSQVLAEDPEAALRGWVDAVDLDAIHGLTSKSRKALREAFMDPGLVLLDGVVNVWCTHAMLRGKGALLNIVETRSRRRRALGEKKATRLSALDVETLHAKKGRVGKP